MTHLPDHQLQGTFHHGAPPLNNRIMPCFMKENRSLDVVGAEPTSSHGGIETQSSSLRLGFLGPLWVHIEHLCLGRHLSVHGLGTDKRWASAPPLCPPGTKLNAIVSDTTSPDGLSLLAQASSLLITADP